MYKADICRAAYLYLHGGYYFDVDVLGELTIQTCSLLSVSMKNAPSLTLASKMF